MPGSVQSLVQARLDRLDPADKAALQAASVLGQRFDRDALATCSSARYDARERLVATTWSGRATARRSCSPTR